MTLIPDRNPLPPTKWDEQRDRIYHGAALVVAIAYWLVAYVCDRLYGSPASP